MSIDVIKAFIKEGYVVENRGTIHTIRGSEKLARGAAVVTILNQQYCPVMSPHRKMGLLEFTLVPYKKPEEFERAECEKNNLSKEELSRTIEATRSLVIDRLAPIYVAGKKIFDSLPQAKLEVFSHCDRPSSIVIDFAYEAPNEGRALDLGCGKGVNATALLKKGWAITAVDNEKEALTYFRNAVSAEDIAKLTLVHSDVTECVFPPESADLVICVDVLPYIESSKLEGLIAKIRSALAPNGTFIGSIFFSPPEKASAFTELMSKLGAHFYPDSSIAPSLLEASGFRVEECSYRADGPKLNCVEFRATKTDV